MADHIYDKNDLIRRFEAILGKTFEEIDDKGLFQYFKETPLQKGIAGDIIEQCVLGYAPDGKQEADLLIHDNGKYYPTELKTTGMLIKESKSSYYVAKEPMSITAVGIYDIADQTFENSHFWNKLEHMLIVYYHYLFSRNQKVTAYDYRLFPVKGYEFHEFTNEERAALEQDWQIVHDLISKIVARHPGDRDKQWKSNVKDDYLESRGVLRRLLSYVDLAPKFPPRFRLKQPIVSSMISKHFGYQLEQLPGKYTFITDIDDKCKELTSLYAGKKIDELAKQFNVPISSNKAFAEQIIIKMFGGKSKELNKIELFNKFGLIAKSITLTPKGGRTEDMKLFRMDFDELARSEVFDDDGKSRPIVFEDSELYSYFADHEFLCIVFEEPEKEYTIDTQTGKRIEIKHPISENKFVGFKRYVFHDDFIDTYVKRLWDDTRDKIINNKLEDIINYDSQGNPKVNKSGSISSAPNFLKSRNNDVFLRGSGTDSSLIHKTETVNGIQMLPQYVWVKGKAIVSELEKAPLL